jgi:two-component system sensor histidine kinase RegB
MNGLAVVCMGLLFCDSRPVAELSFRGGGQEIGDLTTAQWGLFVAFVACASVIVYFTTRLTGELRRREAELFRAEMLQARSEKIEALGTLAAGAAHELATPLSTIAVVAKEVERELDGHEIPAVVPEDMTVIRNELDRCRAILDRMSTESGQTVGETMAPLATNELLRAVSEPYGRHPLIQTSCSERAANARVRVPKQGLAQALRGIVQNAVDANPNGAPIRISADCDDQYLQITVEDSGRGMTREVLQRAGEPFFTTKEPGSGMGMGLFLARSVIERIDGQIDIQSAAGEGTTVRVTLPIADREEP